MKSFYFRICLLFALASPIFVSADLLVGIGKEDITPPLGTPSAGYAQRNGEGMEGVHDPLMAIALFLSTEDTNLVICSVDHLGFNYEMVQEVKNLVNEYLNVSNLKIFIASSHTHSGGGAYLNIPQLEQTLSGKYNSQIKDFYVKKVLQAIVKASQNKIPALIGIGYGQADNLSKYRGLWPQGISPLSDVAILKITKKDGTPFAVLFNYPVHPTVLTSKNRLFSADFVGYARSHIKGLLGDQVQPIYINGAQGDILPLISQEEDRFTSCDTLGKSLANTVANIWNITDVSNQLEMHHLTQEYSFHPKPTPQGFQLPINNYETELSVLVLQSVHAFVMIPGELSCLYDHRLKELGKTLGYQHVSIFGLVNDAHGYIITPASWKNKTYESNFSFGGENYGQEVEERVTHLLIHSSPLSAEVTHTEEESPHLREPTAGSHSSCLRAFHSL